MSWSRRQRRFALWVTLLTLVLATLAPGISRAAAFAQGQTSPWAKVCTTNPDPRGVSAADAGGDGTASDQAQPGQGGGMLHDCPLCLVRGDSLAPPPAALRVAQATVCRHSVPVLFLQGPRPRFNGCAAQPRAPPGPA